jgi:chromosome segregation ATPase
MSMETNKDGTSSVRIKLAQVISIAGACASILGIFVFIGGFISGERYLSSELSSLRETVAELRSNNAATQDRLNSLGNRLTSIETDTKYISQGVAELRLSAVPRH